MKRLVIQWILAVAALSVAGFACRAAGLGFDVDWGQWPRLFLQVAVLGLVNATLGSILKFLTIPLNCMTFGLVGMLINVGIFLGVGMLGWGYRVDGFMPAMLGSAVFGVVMAIGRMIFLREKDE